MKLELKHLASYLPYELNCRYEGIINGREISKQRREYQKENEPFKNWGHYTPIREIKGLKVAPLKTIRTYKNYWVATCGIYAKGQKGFYNGIGMKPLLHPLSDLTKEIEHNGRRFVPINRLQELNLIGYNDSFPYKLEESLDAFIESEDRLNLCYPYWFFQKMFEWHFDVFGLIEKGLAIDINTL